MVDVLMYDWKQKQFWGVMIYKKAAYHLVKLSKIYLESERV